MSSGTWHRVNLAIRKIVREELHRMGFSVGRRAHVRSTEGNPPLLQLDGFPGEDLDAFLFEPYGFASSIPAGTEVHINKVGGRQWVALGVRDRTARPATLEEGDAVVYTANATILVKGGGKIILNGGTKQVARAGDKVDLSEVTVSGTSLVGQGTVIGGSPSVLVP